MGATAPTGIDRTTPDRLLDAAEALIAEQGVAAVSVRAINQAAEANVAAAHYHFGSKESLVEAALARRMSDLAEERFALLDSEPEPTDRQVVEALVLPLARLGLTEEGRRYLGLMQALHHAGGVWWELVDRTFARQWRRFGPALDRMMPPLDADSRRLRLASISAILFGPMASRLRDPLSADRAAVLEAGVVDIVLAILSAPPHDLGSPQ